MMPLYTPPDLLAAHDEWKANCGPGALAALLGKPLSEVRHAFPWFPARPWTSPTQMGEAITALIGPRGKWTAYGIARGPVDEQIARLPRNGLFHIQIDGPWCNLADRRVAYRYTHCAAVRRIEGSLFVYDINLGPNARPGGWATFDTWNEWIARPMVADTKRAIGWFVRSVFDLPLGEGQ